MKKFSALFFILLCSVAAHAQNFAKEFTVQERPRVEIENFSGQTRVMVDDALTDKIRLETNAAESEIKIQNSPQKLVFQIAENKKRLDLTLRVPPQTRLKITGKDGEIAVLGDIEAAEITTATGTIYADVSMKNVKFNLLWTESRPRFLSETELPEIKEKAGGKFVIAGKFENSSSSSVVNPSKENNDGEFGDEKQKTKNKKPIELNFQTKRGIILLNVPPSGVPPDLRQRALTNAAKAIIRGDDSILTEAIRTVSPKFFGDYAKTLPPRERAPILRNAPNAKTIESNVETLRRVNANVTDKFGRAVNNLQAADFQIFEGNTEREIVAVEPSTTPFNLILLLDVSGSVETRIDFIRKTARNFINTVSPQDKLSVIAFSEDVKVLSGFTTNKESLGKSLDDFEAGGGTALYDALGFALTDTLRPLRGERAAIVILSDGDDNRSFLPFEAIYEAIGESGALIYPLYVPSGLTAANDANDANKALDPLRAKFLSLTTKAESDAKRLAEVSGGAYLPIRGSSDIQKAYDDVVAQLRTAYSVTYRSKSGAQSRLRVAVKQKETFVRSGASIEIVAPQAAAKIENKEITGEIKQIKYQSLTAESLAEIDAANFDINAAPPAFLLKNGANKLAVSRWVSPKRTRSYPYERVYNTLQFQKRASVIPVVKDEGADGDRDFVQFDTIALMNLLEVYTVLGFYDAAQKSPRSDYRLVEQQFNRELVERKLNEIAVTNLSPFEWNLREIKDLQKTVELVKSGYQKISAATNVPLHNEDGLNKFAAKLNGEAANFIEFSRRKSADAANREQQTEQPKETLTTRTKSRITISDYLGGKYFFTVDEAVLVGDTLHLIESKHNQGGKLTNTSDIKDALVKMILYRNLQNVRRGAEMVKFKPVIRLTANLMQGAVSSLETDEKLKEFCTLNNYNAKQTAFLAKLFAEARTNNFLVKLEPASTK